MIPLKITISVRGGHCNYSSRGTKEPHYGTAPGWNISVTNSGARTIVCYIFCPQVTEYTVVYNLFYCAYIAGSGVWVLPSFRDVETHLNPLKPGRLCSIRNTCLNTCPVLCIYVSHMIFRITCHYFLIRRWKPLFILHTVKLEQCS